MSFTGFSRRAAVAVAMAAFALPAGAQQQAAAPSLAVGAVAPNFSLPGATRYGLLQKPVTLAEYRGQTVVLAFFPKARSKG